MSFKRPKLDLSPVWLVSAADPALDWGTEKPGGNLVPYSEAPIRPGEAPDVLVCRPLNWMEAEACEMPLRGDSGVAGRLFAMRQTLEYGLVEVRLGGEEPVSDRQAVWDLIQGHRIDDGLLRSAIRWIVEATRGNPSGRFPQPPGNEHGGAVDGGPLRAGV
jgi:hypothetical protein